MQLVAAAWSVLHVSSLALVVLLLLSATGAAPVNGGNTMSSNATVPAVAGGNPSAPPTTAAGDNVELYACNMCLGRHLVGRKVCPGYWPYCHASCYQHPLPGAVRTGTPGLSSAVPNDDDPCYVVKIYNNGTYDIVQYLDCSRLHWCNLICGGGAVAVDDGGRAPAGAAATSPAPHAPASPQGVLPPRVEEMQVCNTQFTARARAVPPRGA